MMQLRIQQKGRIGGPRRSALQVPGDAALPGGPRPVADLECGAGSPHSTPRSSASADERPGNLEAATAALAPLSPANVRPFELKRGPLGNPATKAALIDAINRGQRIVNYVGHGNMNAWHGDILTVADALQLQNREHLPTFVVMNWLNGYFQDAYQDSLAESLLKSPFGGAIAVWASSSMTLPGEQTAMAKAFYRQAFKAHSRLGDALMRAKFMTSDVDVRRSWILLGDPTLRLR